MVWGRVLAVARVAFLVPHADRTSERTAATTRQYRAFTDCAVRRSNNIRGDTPCIRYAVRRLACMTQHPLTATDRCRTPCRGV